MLISASLLISPSPSIFMDDDIHIDEMVIVNLCPSPPSSTRSSPDPDKVQSPKKTSHGASTKSDS
jgi:hypothetical protein